MKRLLVLVITAWLVVSTARGEGPDNQYLNIYSLIQEADALNHSQPTQALAKYLQAQTTLQRFQRAYPDWNAKVVNFRLNYLALKVEALSAHAPPPPASNSVAVAVKEAVAVPQVPPPNEAERQFNELKQRLQQLEADRAVLEAKLKEALAAQPAMADTRDLSNALSQVKTLERENGLLKVSLAQEKGRTGTPQGAAAGTASLQAENALLRKQVADLRAAPAAGPAAPSSSLAEAQKQIAALQVDKEMWRLERAALESRVRQVGSLTNTSPVVGKANEPARIKELEGERNQLQKKLDEAMKELYGRKGKALSTRLEGMEGQILALRSRLEVFEARQVPYTAEELALFSKPQAQLASAQPDPRAGKKSTRDLPPGTTALVAEAQKFFATRQFDKAEQNYLQVLSRDQSNVPTLANLAAIQMQLNRVSDAEKTIQRALQIDPGSPIRASTPSAARRGLPGTPLS